MDTDQLDLVLRDTLTRWRIPGLAIGIVAGDEIVFAKGYGVQSLESQAPVTSETIFCVASITKPFVATAVMQLVEQGAVELDAPVLRNLPYFKLDDDRYQRITLRQVLSHTSGMPDLDELEYDELVKHPEIDDGAVERFVRVIRSRKMVADPGERFSYSNLAYDVLGDLIAKATGQTFENYMKEQVLRPAGMLHSTLLLDDLDQTKLARPHLRVPKMIVNPVFPYHRADAPASFLHSSVIEMCHWCITCLNQGTYLGRRILRPASLEMMWTPVAQRGYPPLYESAGLGWMLGHIGGYKTVSHGGAGFGWAGFLVLLPELKRAAIILCNEESSAHNQAAQATIDTMLDLDLVPGPISWMVPVCQAFHSGGFRAAQLCYTEIKDNPGFFFDGDELVTLIPQLVSVDKIDLAIEVLLLNMIAFPDHLGSYVLLAKLYLKKDDPAQAKVTLQKARAIAPNSRSVAEMLSQVLNSSRTGGLP